MKGDTMKMKNEKCQAIAVNQLTQRDLSEGNLAAIELHLDECATCRESLATAAANDPWWNETRSLLANDDAEEISDTVSFLNPSDDPRMMGRFSGYEIAGIIGQGGMGIVLKGFDPSLNRYAAIKVLAPQMATRGTARSRFAREAQAAAAVVHDNVIAIHGVSESAGLPYLVMPYVRGESLQKRLDRDGPMNPTEIVRVAHQIAKGLAAAHAQGLVHRDIKPANILMPEGVDRVLITDFGLARAADDINLTGTGTVAGTPQFMSPEQALGDAVDPRSDLFSLGTVMYVMCTGSNPFRSENAYGVIRKIIDHQPKPIRRSNPLLPEWLQMIISKLQSKSPDDRYQSADEVANLLERCLAYLQNPSSKLPVELQQPSIQVGSLSTATSAIVLISILLGSAWSFGLLTSPSDSSLNNSTGMVGAALEWQDDNAEKLKDADPYFIDPNDTLGICIEGVLGSPNSSVNHVPGVVHPVPVREDGSISLPVIGEINASGKTAQQIQASLVQFFKEGDQPILKPEARINVVLLRKTEISKDDDVVPLNAKHLRQQPPAFYLLSDNDILGLFIEGVLGDFDEGITPNGAPIVRMAAEKVPMIGYPVPIRDDGTLSLPLIEPIPVRGLTIQQVEKLIQRAYKEGKTPVIKPEGRIIVTLVRERTYNVTVVRRDGASTQYSSLKLPAYKNDVFNALAKTGGMPGISSAAKVFVMRSDQFEFQERNAAALSFNILEETKNAAATLTIPTKLKKEEAPLFRDADIVLSDGDVVFVDGSGSDIEELQDLIERQSALQEAPSEDEQRLHEQLSELSTRLTELKKEGNFIEGKLVERVILELLKEHDKDHEVIQKLRDRMIALRLKGEHDAATATKNRLQQAESALQERYSEIEKISALESYAELVLSEPTLELNRAMAIKNDPNFLRAQKRIEDVKRQIKSVYENGRIEDLTISNSVTEDRSNDPNDTVFILMLQQAEADVVAGTGRHKSAINTLRHTQSLSKKGYVTKQAVDDAIADADNAKLQLKHAETVLQKIKDLKGRPSKTIAEQLELIRELRGWSQKKE